MAGGVVSQAKLRLRRTPCFSRLGFLVTLLAVLVCIIVPVYVAWYKGGEPDLNAYVEFTYSTGKQPVGLTRDDGVAMYVYLTNLDQAKNSFSIRCDFLHIGENLADESLVFNFNDAAYKKPNGSSSLTPFDGTYYFVSGDMYRYPFDHYEGGIYISAEFANETEVPFNLFFVSAFSGFDVTSSYSFYNPPANTTTSSSAEDAGTDARTLYVSAKRSATTLGFSLFAMIVMWVISISFAMVVFDVFFRHRNPEPPILGACVSMIFALPALRNAQPNVPPVGCAADLLSFIWCIFIVVCTACSMIIMYVSRWKPPAPPAPQAPPTQAGAQDKRGTAGDIVVPMSMGVLDTANSTK